MKPTLAFALTLVALSSTGCAIGLKDAPPPVMAADAAQPAVLERSLYAKDHTGALSESDLQAILEMPIDLQFPARVGVVPLAEAFDPTAPVSITMRGTASRDLASALIGHPHLSHVSDVSTELPHVGGIEGLRVIAARYRLRYLLLYSERFVDDTHLNGWAWLYPTIIGMFAAPGVTVESSGFAQVDLLDVRTGTVLFTLVEPMQVSSNELMIGAAREHTKEQANAGAAAAGRLAKRVGGQIGALIAFADKRDDARVTRILPAPVAPMAGREGATGEAVLP
jgi:hypothetical protein